MTNMRYFINFVSLISLYLFSACSSPQESQQQQTQSAIGPGPQGYPGLGPLLAAREEQLTNSPGRVSLYAEHPDTGIYSSINRPCESEWQASLSQPNGTPRDAFGIADFQRAAALTARQGQQLCPELQTIKFRLTKPPAFSLCRPSDALEGCYLTASMNGRSAANSWEVQVFGYREATAEERPLIMASLTRDVEIQRERQSEPEQLFDFDDVVAAIRSGDWMTRFDDHPKSFKASHNAFLFNYSVQCRSLIENPTPVNTRGGGPTIYLDSADAARYRRYELSGIGGMWNDVFMTPILSREEGRLGMGDAIRTTVTLTAIASESERFVAKGCRDPEVIEVYNTFKRFPG